MHQTLLKMMWVIVMEQFLNFEDGIPFKISFSSISC